nr:hypothetical protein [Cellulosimicrobium sp. MM]
MECEARARSRSSLLMTKSFSMAGWRVAFLVGRRDVVGALAS